MHVLVGLLALIGAAIFLWYRLRDAREAGGEMLDAADSLRAKVRKLMYQRKHDRHPADQVEDPRLAAAGIAVAVATMDGPITQAEIETLTRVSREVFDVSDREALDIVSYGRWVAGQCNTNGEAVRRLAKVVAREAGAEAAGDMVRMISEVATAGGTEMGEDEMDAIDTVRHTLGVV